LTLRKIKRRVMNLMVSAEKWGREPQNREGHKPTKLRVAEKASAQDLFCGGNDKTRKIAGNRQR